eukprot:256684_1
MSNTKNKPHLPQRPSNHWKFTISVMGATPKQRSIYINTWIGGKASVKKKQAVRTEYGEYFHIKHASNTLSLDLYVHDIQNNLKMSPIWDSIILNVIVLPFNHSSQVVEKPLKQLIRELTQNGIPLRKLFSRTLLICPSHFTSVSSDEFLKQSQKVREGLLHVLFNGFGPRAKTLHLKASDIVMMESGRKSSMLPTAKDWRVNATEYVLKYLILSDRDRKAFIAWISNCPNPLRMENIRHVCQRLKTWKTSRRRCKEDAENDRRQQHVYEESKQRTYHKPQQQQPQQQRTYAPQRAYESGKLRPRQSAPPAATHKKSTRPKLSDIAKDFDKSSGIEEAVDSEYKRVKKKIRVHKTRHRTDDEKTNTAINMKKFVAKVHVTEEEDEEVTNKRMLQKINRAAHAKTRPNDDSKEAIKTPRVKHVTQKNTNTVVKPVQKLEHHRVDQMSFSPNETFLITCNATAYENQNGQRQTPQLKIWDVLTGNLIIDVSYKTIGPTIKLRLPGWWPIFKWSHDEKYIAKVNSSKGMTVKAKDLNKINIYHIRALSQDDDTYDEKTRFKIEKLGGKSLTVGSLFNMEFSPTDNILSYTCFAQNDDQSKVTLISIPSKKHLKTQTLGFDVKKAHLYWQSQGRYLAINMAHSQSKKNRTTKDHSIGIMTVKDRNMPFSRTDNLGKVMYFCWEPDGDRFAVIHDVTKREEPNVSIYRVQDMGVDKGSSRLVLTLKKRRCNELYWAPKGGRLVMANVDKTRRAGGELEFVDINKIRNTGDESQTVKNIIHENMTDIQWDPSGRFLLTATTQHLGSTSGDDTRYVVWSFQGDKLFEHKIKYFYQILWRPRPSKLEKLQRTDKQKINHKRANEWDRTFRAYDMEKRTETVNKKLLDNQKKLKLFQQTIEKLKKKTTNFRTQRDALRGGATYSYQIKTIQQRLEKGRPEQYELDKDTMRKILSGEIVDYNKWRNEKQ